MLSFSPTTEKGFTLMETLVTIGIFTIMMLGVTLLFKNVFVDSRQQILSLNNVDQARTVENRFINEIRNANYGIDGSYPITKADNSEIIFYTTYPSQGTTTYRVRYYLSGTTLYRGVVTPTGSPLTYVLANEKVSAVQNDVTNGATPFLYYYDGSYTGSSASLTQPVNLNQVKFVEMRLSVLKQVTRGSPNAFTIRAGGAVRNLKSNLGN